MAFGENKVVSHRDKIQVELIRLSGGSRLLRLNYAPLGLVLEHPLNSELPLVRQKERMFSVFEAALAKAELTAA